MPNALQPLRKNFNDLTLRERAITTVMVAGVIWLAVDFLLLSGLKKKEEVYSSEKIALEAQLKTIDDQILKLKDNEQVAGATDPKFKNEIISLNSEISAIDQQSVILTSGVVKPKEIVGILKNVLVDTEGLKLVRLNVLDATTLDDTKLTNLKKALFSNISSVYKHEIEIELHGGYLSTLKYLKKLESFQGVFYWSEISYEAKAWPNARVILNVYTLSLKKDKSDA